MRIPKYYRVKSEILDLIADLPPGTMVPTERDLAERLETSRTTVRQAIADLVIDGRLERTQGRGTFVAEPRLMQIRQLTSFSQDTTSEGRRAGSEVLDVSAMPADAEVAEHLEIAAGDSVHRVERLRTAGGERIAHETAYLPGPLPHLEAELAARGSLYRTMAEVYRMNPSDVQDIIETMLADPVDSLFSMRMRPPTRS